MSVDVLHLSTEPAFRGGERQLLSLHEGLGRRGIRSYLLCRAGGELASRATGRRSSFAWSGLADLAGFARARKMTADLAPALIHCHDSKAFTLGSVIGRWLDTPVINTRRVAFPVRPSAFSRWKYRRARRVVAVSSGVASRLAGFAPPERIRVVHDGVSWDGPRLPREQARRELGLEPEVLVAGTVGFFSREKNLQAVFQLAEALPAVRFVCLGPMDSASQARANSIPGLLAPGPVEEARDYYPAFDLYVSPSTSEGLGTALLDAVVRDIPAVALDALGNREIYPEGSPWLAPDATALAAAIRSVVDDLSAAGETARQHGERARGIFTTARMVDGNAAVYRELLAPSPPTDGRDRARPRGGPGLARR